jgi:hypothetical protein
MATIERIIEQEIFANASTLISSLCRLEDPELMNVDQEELFDVCSQPDYSVAPEGYEIEKSMGAYYWHREAEGQFDDAELSDSVFNTPEAASADAWQDYGDTPDDYIEALQHWIISDWLAEKIIEIGGMAATDICGFSIWGRSECGQGLDIDSTLKAVVELLDNDQ